MARWRSIFLYRALHHFLSRSRWNDQSICDDIARRVNAHIGGPGSGLINDPFGVPKKGNCSVAVGSQWLGTVGEIDNGQLAVTAALVRGRDAALIDKELYLPESWLADSDRCDKAGIPKDKVAYRSNGKIVLEMIQRLMHFVTFSWIGMDSEFGKYWWLLDKLHKMGMVYVVDARRIGGFTK